MGFLPQIVGAIGFLIIFLGFVLLLIISTSRKKQTLLEQAYQAQLATIRHEVQEQTYQAIAMELHDNVGQLLSSSKMMINAAMLQSPETAQSLDEAQATLGKAIQEVRSLSKMMNAKWLEQFSLRENLQQEISRLQHVVAVQADLDALETISLHNDQQLIIFRVAQEAMQNAMKHAAATVMTLECMEKTGSLVIRIADNGKGMTDSVKSGTGSGLLHMRERIALLKGNIQWQNNVPSGTIVELDIPLR
ncbi:MAG: hypothetical protein J0L83_12080 [Chitinophagales bacterium]|jgi:signal transduction histidine kinase|nr:hypothetical protein [Chitinophagales bacterium]